MKGRTQDEYSDQTNPQHRARKARKKPETRPHVPVAELKRKRDAWNAETESLRFALSHRTQTHPEDFEGPNKVPKDGTEAETIADTIRRRMRGENPHQAELDAATAIFHARDVEKSNNSSARTCASGLRNCGPSARTAAEQIVSAAEALRIGLRGLSRERAMRSEP